MAPQAPGSRAADPPARLQARDVTLRYGERAVSQQLSFSLAEGRFTAIVGPNACGKSTLLRALSRLIRPVDGEVVLDGRLISTLPARQVARILGLLPQSSSAPDGMIVADLVARGRFPHQSLLQRWTAEDEQAVARALQVAGVAELAGRAVDELSGGQRQRVWIAMVLAQETPILLLDEPTTFLDIAHQIDLLNLLRRLNRQSGNTILAVLHDLNHACRYADHIVAMRDGRIIAEGPPGEIMTAALVKDVFGLGCIVTPDPVTAKPMVVPLDEPQDDAAQPGSALPAHQQP